MKQVFTVGWKNPDNGRWVAVLATQFDSFRTAQDYLDEFYPGPNYKVLSRHQTDWIVAL
jgi:hypothetical protein